MRPFLSELAWVKIRVVSVSSLSAVSIFSKVSIGASFSRVTG